MNMTAAEITTLPDTDQRLLNAVIEQSNRIILGKDKLNSRIWESSRNFVAAAGAKFWGGRRWRNVTDSAGNAPFLPWM